MNSRQILIIVYSIVLILLLFLSFFFSSSDMAYGSVDILRFEREKDNNKKSVKYAYKLAKNINMPTSRIQDILKDKRKITIDTSIRLTRYFNEIDKYFLNLQNDINICNALLSINNELGNIKRFYKLDEFIK